MFYSNMVLDRICTKLTLSEFRALLFEGVLIYKFTIIIQNVAREVVRCAKVLAVLVPR